MASYPSVVLGGLGGLPSTTVQFWSAARSRNCSRRVHAGISGRFRAAVQAAAENTSTFATITGHAPMTAPYVTHIAAPSICTALSTPGRAQKYDATNTVVAAHPKISTVGVPIVKIRPLPPSGAEGFR